jgi:MoaA/NifB/PqqE/SkfB family radical SAM enzyme
MFELEICNSGGMLLTYWCNATCANCYENCGPNKNSVMPVEDAKEYMIELKKLGCVGQGFHFAGGEPFRNYNQLIKFFESARDVDMLPLGTIETNAFWCTNDELVEKRLTEIRDFGLNGIFISCDVFHQEFVPIERVSRCIRVGKEVLGEGKVHVRFWEFYNDPVFVTDCTEEQKNSIFREQLKRGTERMCGRAVQKLAHLLPCFPPEKFANNSCANPILKSKHIHIDPYGNVFPLTCAGLNLGNAKKQKLSSIYEEFNYLEHPLLKILLEEGVIPIMKEAEKHGFRIDDRGYADKCHLCFEVRRFLFLKGLYPDEIGPEEIYTD